MRHRGLAALLGSLLVVACAPAAAGAATGVGTAPGEGSPSASGRGFGPTTDAGPSGPRALAAPAPPGAAGIGDPYFPLEGNGGSTPATTTSPSPTTRRPTGSMPSTGSGR